MSYAIYIWDTRQVVETKHFDDFEEKREYALSKCSAALDNHKQLLGSGYIVRDINLYMQKDHYGTAATEATRRTFTTPTKLDKGAILVLDGYGADAKFRYEGITSKKLADIKKYDKTHVCEDAMDSGFKGWFVVVTSLNREYDFADGSKTGALPYGANGIIPA